MDLTNLRNKTIFDFTDDLEILEELVSTTDEETFLKGVTPIGRAFSMIYYAEYIQNDEMVRAVKKAFEPEFSNFITE